MLKDRFIPLYDRFGWKFMVIFDNFDLDALHRGNKICCSVFSSDDDSAIGKFMKACWGCVRVQRSDWLTHQVVRRFVNISSRSARKLPVKKLREITPKMWKSQYVFVFLSN